MTAAFRSSATVGHGFRGGAVTALVALAIALSGCGDGDGDTADASAAPPTTTPPTTNPPATGTNRTPSIAGSPRSSVLVGSAYSFTPTAADADNDTLTFQITGRPAWASFSTTTGALTGTPAAGDVGTYSNIVIRVTDGTASATLASFSINVVATASGSATLSWTPPTQYLDGSPLSDLTGYRVYWGTVQNSLTNSATLNNSGLTSYVVEQLTPATWYFAVTSVNSQNVESSLSNVTSKVIR